MATPVQHHPMTRHSVMHDGLALSYLDAGGPGELLVALHATWMEAGTFEELAQALAPDWRVVALDQRGHGHSGHAARYTWDGWVGDLQALLAELGAGDQRVVLLGNSLGGTVAFKFAALHPGRVRALVIEESPAEEDSNLDFIRPWEGTFPTREALLAEVGERFAWSVEPSVRHTAAGWTLAFSPKALADAQAGLNGDFWDEWTATDCPALVVRGTESRAVDGAVLEKMAATRPHTELVSFEAGHVIHHDKPQAFAAAVKGFLARTLEVP